MDKLRATEKITCHQLSCLVVASFICPTMDENKPLVYSQLTTRGNLILLLLELIQHIDMDWGGIKNIFSKYFENSDIALSLLENKLVELHKEKCQRLSEFISVLDKLNICRKSLLGVFIRKVALAYKNMSFRQLGKFEQDLSQYLRSASPHIVHIDEERVLQIEDETEFSIEMDSEEKGKEQKEYLLDTVTHANQFVSQQVALISSQNPAALPPRVLEEKIAEILERFPGNVNVHFLAYLNYSRVKEVNKSIVELHQYFDKKKWREDESASTGEAPSDRTAAEDLQAKFKRFRYCALNLGILHFHLGHLEEAIASFEEAVKMAQETSDQDCLEHAMFWLLNIRGQGLGRTKTETKRLDFTTVEQKEHFIPQLQSLSVLQRCKDKAFQGSDGAARVIDELRKAEIVYPKIVNKLHATMAALLDFYGMSSVASVISQMPLFYGSDPGLSPIFKVCKGLDDVDYESHCLALCQVAKFHADEGLFNEADLVLNYGSQKVLQNDDLLKWITTCRAQISFDKAIMKRNLEEASSAADIISLYDTDEAQYRHCVVAFLRNDVAAAADKARDLLQMYDLFSRDTQGFVAQSMRNPTDIMRLKLLLAEVKMASDDVPGAMSLLLEALSTAKKFRTMGYESQAILMISLCQIHLGLPHQALKLLSNGMVQILAHGSLYLRTSAFLCLVKCQFVLLLAEEDADKKSALLGIIPYLEKCIAGFRRLSSTAKVAETLCVQAHVYNMLEYTSERNHVAKEFGKVKSELTNCPSTLYL